MRKALFIIIFYLLSAPHIGAQVVYIDTTGVKELKRTTTIFVLPEADSMLKEQYQQAISNSWKITPYRIVSAGQLPQYAGKEGYSFFCEIRFGKIQIDDPSPDAPPLQMQPVPYNGSEKMLTKASPKKRSGESELLDFPDKSGDYAYYSLFIKQPNDSDNQKVVRYADVKMGTTIGHDIYVPIYKRGYKFNPRDPYWKPYWNPGLLKMYLHIINIALGDKENQRMSGNLLPYSNYEDTAAMAGLVHDTLYIPDYILSSISNVWKRHHFSVADVTGNYTYPSRIVTAEQLSDLLLNCRWPINFLTYNPYYPGYICFDKNNPQYNKDLFGTDVVHGNMTRKGVKVYNIEIGIIYSDFPSAVGFHSSILAATSFADDDLQAIANTVKQGH